MLTEPDIREALRACYDAGNPYKKPVNIVDLGCIERISLALDLEAPGAGIPGVPPRQRLTLEIIPTSDDEDANVQLSAQIQNCLAGLPELSRTSLTLLDEPWTPDRLSADARRRLKLDPTPFPILNNRRPL
jgi:metal-sulfur cluster biosynthetic enzyme